MTTRERVQCFQEVLGLSDEQFEAAFGVAPSSVNNAMPTFVEHAWVEFWRLRLRDIRKIAAFRNISKIAADNMVSQAVVQSWVDGDSGPSSLNHVRAISGLAKKAGVKGPYLQEVLESLEKKGITLETVTALEKEPLPGKPVKATYAPPTKELSAREFFEELPKALESIGTLGGRCDALEDIFYEVADKTKDIEAFRAETSEVAAAVREVKETVSQLSAAVKTISSEPEAVFNLKQGQKDAAAARGELAKKIEGLVGKVTGLEGKLVSLMASQRELTDELEELEEKIVKEVTASATLQMSEFLKTVRGQLATITTRLDGGPAQAAYPAHTAPGSRGGIEEAVKAYIDSHLREIVVEELGSLNAQEVFDILKSEEGRQLLKELATSGIVRRVK